MSLTKVKGVQTQLGPQIMASEPVLFRWGSELKSGREACSGPHEAGRMAKTGPLLSQWPRRDPHPPTLWFRMDVEEPERAAFAGSWPGVAGVAQCAL